MIPLAFDLEGRLVEARTNELVRAEALSVRPDLIGFDTTGIPNSNSTDEEFLRRLDQAVNQEKQRQMLPFSANAYVPSIAKAAGRDQGYVWVAIQFYKIK